MNEARPSKEEQWKGRNPHHHCTLKQFQNTTLHKSLNIDLYGVSSINKMFLAWVLKKFENKTSRFLWKINFMG